MDGANNDELRRERPERAASSQPRATPWVSAYKALRPVRAKVWAHLLFITFALTGRRCGTYVNPGRCPGLRTCWAFSPRRPPATLPRNISINSNHRPPSWDANLYQYDTLYSTFHIQSFLFPLLLYVGHRPDRDGEATRHPNPLPRLPRYGHRRFPATAGR